MLVMSAQHGWINHQLGLAKIIQLRGPEAYSHPDSLSLFEGNRFMIILASLATSSSTFLSQPAWKTIPWSRNPESKSIYQYLLDLIADIPELKQRQSLVTTADDLLRNDPNLYRDALDVIHRLREWRTTWDRLPESHTTVLHESSEIDVVSQSLHFSSLEAANCVTTYNAALIGAIETLVCAPGYNNSSESAAELSHVARLSASEICRSLAYFLMVKHNMVGQFMLLWPIRMAWKAFDGSSTPEGRWLERKLSDFLSSQQSWEVTKQTISYRTAGRQYHFA